MKLIIDIPEEKIAIEYEKVVSIGRNNDKELADYIFAGTPLEKHDEEVIKKTVESIWGKPPYTEALDDYINELIDKCMETLFDATLDKIRADIEFLANSMAGHTGMVCAEDVFAIINKYRGE